MVGLCCVQYDPLFDNNLRLYIKNIICRDYKNFEIFAVKFLKFIMSNFTTEEIYIDLYYENKNGNFEVNENILKILKNSLGFKWTKLENKIGERFQKMCIKLPQNKTEEKEKENESEIDNKKDKNNLKKYKHCLEITSSSTLKFKYENGFDAAGSDDNYKDTENAFNNEENNFEENVNFFMVLHSLLNLNQIDDYEVKGDLINKMDYNKFKVKKT